MNVKLKVLLLEINGKAWLFGNRCKKFHFSQMVELLVPKLDIFASLCLYFTHCEDSSPYHFLGHVRPFKELISLNKFNHLLSSHKMCHCCPKSHFFEKTFIFLLFFDIYLIICFSKNFYAWHTNLYSETVLLNKCVLNN